MNDDFQTLYTELREMHKELIDNLKQRKGKNAIIPLIKAEINDINRAIKKLESGKYGICEVTGKEIEKELLFAIPTIQTIDEVHEISRYLSKPIYE